MARPFYHVNNIDVNLNSRIRSASSGCEVKAGASSERKDGAPVGRSAKAESAGPTGPDQYFDGLSELSPLDGQALTISVDTWSHKARITAFWPLYGHQFRLCHVAANDHVPSQE
jgi:hypothetical protein